MIRATIFHSGRHVEADGLIDATSACPVCGFTGDRPRRVRLQTAPEVWLLHCPACRAASASHLPDAATLERFYLAYYEPARPRGTFRRPTRLARHIVENAFARPPESPLGILDYGGGDGYLAIAIAAGLAGRSGGAAHISLVDYNTEILPSPSPAITVRHARTLDPFEDQRFDLVLASSILEHLPYPGQIARKLLQLLNPDGVFFVRTPYVVPFLRVLGPLGVNIDFTFPGHIHDLGQPFWDRCLRAFGLDEASYRIVRSRPSLVETTLFENPPRTLAAYALKAPWRLLGRYYPFVGGWEVFIRRMRV